MTAHFRRHRLTPCPWHLIDPVRGRRVRFGRTERRVSWPRTRRCRLAAPVMLVRGAA